MVNPSAIRTRCARPRSAPPSSRSKNSRLQSQARWNDLIVAHVSDLGGLEMLSEAQISIIRRVSAIECELEAMEGRMSARMPIEIEVYGRLASRLCRLLELVGVKRVTRPIDPLSEFAKSFEGYPPKPPDEDDEDEPAPIEEEPGEA